MTSDKAVRLGAILDWLEKGRVTTADAAARIKGMDLGKGTARSAGETLGHEANGDLPAHDPASFAAVCDAYAGGRITLAQYQALSEAAGLK